MRVRHHILRIAAISYRWELAVVQQQSVQAAVQLISRLSMLGYRASWRGPRSCVHLNQVHTEGRGIRNVFSRKAGTDEIDLSSECDRFGKSWPTRMGGGK